MPTFEEKKTMIMNARAAKLEADSKQAQITRAREALEEQRSGLGRAEALMTTLAEGTTLGMQKSAPEKVAQAAAIMELNDSGPFGPSPETAKVALKGLDPEEIKDLRRTSAAKSIVAREKFPVQSVVTEGAGALSTAIPLAAPALMAAPVAGKSALAARVGIGAIESGLVSAASTRAEPGSKRWFKDVGIGMGLGAVTMGTGELIGAATRAMTPMVKSAVNGVFGTKGREVASDTATVIAKLNDDFVNGSKTRKQVDLEIANANAKAESRLAKQIKKSGRGMISGPVMGVLEATGEGGKSAISAFSKGGRAQNVVTGAGAPAVAAAGLNETQSLFRTPGGP